MAEATIPTSPQPGDQGEPCSDWEMARSNFPRVPFPWQFFPAELTNSIDQLARSCATSPTPLAGAIFGIIGTLLGRSVSVSPKEGWEEPAAIIWHGDIRMSGAGKTPALSKLIAPLSKMEAAIQREFTLTDLTLAGLRTQMEEHQTGGMLCDMNELSAFITGQNQYRGSDRETWIRLWDGKNLRFRFHREIVTIFEPRVSVVGGIQPWVFKHVFGGRNGLYLQDGTIYRFLFTYEPSAVYEHTADVWEQGSREVWSRLVAQAVHWVQCRLREQGGIITTPHFLRFDREAQGYFLSWLNELEAAKVDVPSPVHGFISKARSYGLKLVALVHCIRQFLHDEGPADILAEADVKAGLSVMNFYLGQAVSVLDMMRHEELEDKDLREVSPRTRILAQTLNELKGEVDEGKLAIGLLTDKFNAGAPKALLMSAKGMGVWLKALRLTKSEEKLDANGRRAVFCLRWDEKTDKFIEENSGY